MLAFQLFVEDENLGALNLYAKEPHVFDDDSEHIGLLVAAHAAVAFAESRRTVQLNEAIMTRDVIGQAKGILMERHKITSQQAFLLLTTASNRTNTRLDRKSGGEGKSAGRGGRGNRRQREGR